jgi:hypothetical protein
MYNGTNRGVAVRDGPINTVTCQLSVATVTCHLCHRDMVWQGYSDVPVGEPPMDYDRADSLAGPRIPRNTIKCGVYRCGRCRTIRAIKVVVGSDGSPVLVSETNGKDSTKGNSMNKRRIYIEHVTRRSYSIAI